MVPIVSFVGKSNVGKTTFLEKVIAEFKRRGVRVGVVKHDVHGFELDQPGKDTWRLARAGADAVAISSRGQYAVIGKREGELSLDDLAARLAGDIDILLTEGYKSGPKPKVEVSRKAVSSELLSSRSELVAIVTDQAFALDVPQYGLDDAEGIVDLLTSRFLVREEQYAASLIVDGKVVSINPFVQRFLSSTTVGMVRALQGGETGHDIRLTIHVD